MRKQRKLERLKRTIKSFPDVMKNERFETIACQLTHREMTLKRALLCALLADGLIA